MRRFLMFSVLAATFGICCSARADPLIIERIVATVDGQPLFLSTLRERAQPFVYALTTRGIPRWQQAAARKLIYRRLLRQLIDDALIARAARKAHIVIHPADVDRALQEFARDNKIDRKTLLDQALEQGYTSAQYRALFRREILQGLMLERYMSARGIHPKTDQAAKKERQRWLAKLRRRAVIVVRLAL